jgi:ABC-type cobalamin/Fe3+-siderophores transport system ATPase subunit
MVAAGPHEAVLQPELLSEVYQRDIEVLTFPDDGRLLVRARRPQRSARAPSSTPNNQTAAQNQQTEGVL